jgi:hypothetical protein
MDLCDPVPEGRSLDVIFHVGILFLSTICRTRFSSPGTNGRNNTRMDLRVGWNVNG